MNKPLDPYEELGVGRNASTGDVRRAYRKRAKETHPDSGGKAEEFDRVRRSMTVLTDPFKRERFDNTGNAEDGPDNTRSNALQVIEKHISDLVSGYMSGRGDPRQMDVVAHLKNCINEELKQQRASIKDGERIIEFLKDMSKRMTTDSKDDPLGHSMAAHIQHAERQKHAVEDGIASRKLALKIVSHYSFRWDQPAANVGTAAGAFTFTVRIG